MEKEKRKKKEEKAREKLEFKEGEKPAYTSGFLATTWELDGKGHAICGLSPKQRTDW